MKIKHLIGAKSGTIEHIDNSTGNLLIAAGLAEHIPYKDFRERLAAEGQGMKTPVPTTVQWGVRLSTSANARSKALVVKTVGSETTYYDAPPKDCPRHFVDRFIELSGQDAQFAKDNAETERLKREQYAQKDSEVAGRARVLYSR
jgi:hypothetical protein